MSVQISSVRFRKRWILVLAAGLLIAGYFAYGKISKPPAERIQAQATFIAGPLENEISGTVSFRNVPGGTLVTAQVTGLPAYKAGRPPVGPFGFHIHEHGSCEIGTPGNAFADAGGHWNPDNEPHGNHAGDFPVLFSNGGKAEMTFFTNRFQAEDVIGKTVMIHLNPDDYRTQPAGDSGARLACGVIVSHAS